MESPINLLVSLDENYLPQLRVMLTSFHINHPQTPCRLYLLHREFSDKLLENLRQGLRKWDISLFPIQVDEKLFQDAPVTRYYSQEMYYRLLAAQFLPDQVERVLYLDPDVLIINSLLPLWQMDMGTMLFAAAAHTGKTELANTVNRVRLGTKQDYYNSGVLLLNLPQCRRQIDPNEVFSFVREHAQELILPDQDVLNALYGNKILEIDDVLWNYDARNYSSYLLRSGAEADLPWVMSHTSILHFCGKEKPWKPHYRHRFGVVYLHYMNLTERMFPSAEEDPQ